MGIRERIQEEIRRRWAALKPEERTQEAMNKIADDHRMHIDLLTRIKGWFSSDPDQFWFDHHEQTAQVVVPGLGDAE